MNRRLLAISLERSMFVFRRGPEGVPSEKRGKT
jgi:hypothetical protein